MKTRKLGSGEFTHYDLEGRDKDDRKRKEEPLEEANLMVRVCVLGDRWTDRNLERHEERQANEESGELRRSEMKTQMCEYQWSVLMVAVVVAKRKQSCARVA